MKRHLLYVAFAALFAVVPCLAVLGGVTSKVDEKLDAGLWNANRAMKDIAAQLSFGPRSPGTVGHEKEIQYIEAELAKTKADSVKTQQWADSTGQTPAGTAMGWTGSGDNAGHSYVNIVARFHPEKSERVIVGTHFDSIIRAYRDPVHPDAPMPGANNSASGVALLLETARALSDLPDPPYGIDFVFFDGEEGPKALGAGDPQWHAIGSPYFVQHLDEFYPNSKPVRDMIFDMVCYKNLELNPEQLSLSSARAEVLKFWHIGTSIAPTIFKQDTPYNYPIDDDQDAFAKIGIPSVLVIGFKYEPYFNTTQDTLDKCSSATLSAVGRTLVKYLYQM